MAYDAQLAEQIRATIGERGDLVEKQMFGGLGFLLAGNMTCGAWKEFLILRLGVDAARQVLSEPHSRPFDITGKPMRGWAMIEPAGWKSRANVRRWIGWAVDFVETLPPK